RLHLPGGPGVRIDTALYAGCSVVPFYDPMIAKVICWGRDRDEALGRMVQALSEFEITGIQTTLPFLQELIETSAFESSRVHTQFLEEYLAHRPSVPDLSEQKAV
ncbi:MAG: hypothetical protein IMW91_07610, partial [Firmicutes bacterium]|nr:hypothetical protein [Bacillota bacterium]